MAYSIWLIHSPYDVHFHMRCFEEIALGLSNAFGRLGHEAPIVYHPSHAQGTTIVLAGRVLHEIHEKLPKDMIIYNLEQVHARSPFFSPPHPYVDFLRRYPVWDYSHNNINALKPFGITPTALCRIGYVPELSRIASTEQEDIDVLLIGTWHGRREHIMAQLRAHGVKLHHISAQYGKERDEIIARAKIIVNIHMQPANIFEIARVSYLLANAKCVISEIGDDRELEAPFAEAVAFAPYDKLVETCLNYLQNDTARRNQARRGFEVFSKMPQEEYLFRALQEHEAACREKSMSAVSLRPNIFVQIAAYRDAECQHTVKDLFEKAKRPERISVGICWQADADKDQACFAVPYPFPQQVRELRYTSEESQGANWARAEARKLWQGEEYTLLIDAHMRFERGWDETLIEMLERCPAEKPVVTGWLPGYAPPDKRTYPAGKLPRVHISELDKSEYLQMVLQMYHFSEGEITRLQPTALLVQNFIFTRSRAFEEVPIDPQIFFWGDEINLSLRMWTHGYDFFQYDRPVAYHYWDRKVPQEATHYRTLASERHKDSRARNLHLLGLRPCEDARVLKDIERYPLGTARTLEDYYSFAGFDLRRMELKPFAQKGEWAAAPARLPRIFIMIASYRDAETRPTVNDLFAKAAHPERVLAGICWQTDKEADAHCFAEPYTHPDRVREIYFTAAESQGANWARCKAFGLWQGEEFVLMIDAHMRFAPGWDDILLDTHAKSRAEKTVVTVFPCHYDPPDHLEPMHGLLPFVCINYLGAKESTQLVNLGCSKVPAAQVTALKRTPFVVNCCVFAPAAMFRDVPIDPHIYFYGDELSLSARLWTHGWDIYQPQQTVAWHHWPREYAQSAHYKKQEAPQSRRSAERLHRLLRLDFHDEKALKGYGLGDQRSIHSFWKVAGIDMENWQASEEARQGDWHWEYAQAAGQPSIFVAIAAYRDAQMQHTVADLFAKAKYPDRITVGVCAEYDMQADARHLPQAYPRPQQVRVKQFDPAQSHGEGWARMQAQTLWQGEDYVLQVASAARFAEGWDEMLITMLEQHDDAKTVISSPLGAEREKTPRITVEAIAAYNDPAVLRLGAKKAKARQKGLLQTPFAQQDFLFGRSDAFRLVPADPYILAAGGDITLSARLWTHGYRILSPGRAVAWRASMPDAAVSAARHPHANLALAGARVRHLLGLEYAQEGAALSELERYGHGTARSMESFWRFAGVDMEQGVISQHAAAGEWNKAVLEEATAVKLPRIFVQIAAYRDPELQWTVAEMFAKATYPERIHAGIIWQYVPREDDALFPKPYPRPKQLRIIEVDARESQGVCWARAKLQELWEGEEYTLQIDSHMRFEQGWDELLIDMLKACGERAVLTTYPAGYLPPRTIQHRLTYRLVAKQFDGDGIFTMTSRPLKVDPPPPAPVEGAFVSACMLFGPGNMIREIPYDPHLYFFGEEITLSARLWTHGYDVYHPNIPVIYHFWERKTRRTHFDDHRQWPEINRRSFARVRHLLGTDRSHDPAVTQDIERYGLGRVRTMEDYQRFCGVDFTRRAISPAAYEGHFPADKAPPPAASRSHAAIRAPNKVMETEDVVVYDDFLPEELYQHIYNFATETDYQYINTHGTVKRVWDLSSGFPLRNDKSIFFYADPAARPQGDFVYPSRTPFDPFIDHVNAAVPQVQHLVGTPVQG
ncbi:MAG: hypothetical protein JO089_01420, partial [Alphaproteobacteria bacterium]|nr:hypothetical protein [Alphaproteobacteria bacterium]